MSSRTYLTYELKRTFRNRRFFFFSLAFPLLLFLSVGGSQRDADIVPGRALSAVLHGGHGRLGRDDRSPGRAALGSPWSERPGGSGCSGSRR